MLTQAIGIRRAGFGYQKNLFAILRVAGKIFADAPFTVAAGIAVGGIPVSNAHFQGLS